MATRTRAGHGRRPHPGLLTKKREKPPKTEAALPGGLTQVGGGGGGRGAGRRLDVEGRAGFEWARAHLGPGTAEGGYLAAVWPEPSDSGKPFKPAGPVSCSLPRRPSPNRPTSSGLRWLWREDPWRFLTTEPGPRHRMHGGRCTQKPGEPGGSDGHHAGPGGREGVCARNTDGGECGGAECSWAPAAWDRVWCWLAAPQGG